MAIEVAQDIEVGNVGAIATTAEGVGYYLVEFTGLPYADQTGELKYNCYWLFEIQRNPYWYYHTKEATVVSMMHVVDTDVQLQYMSPSNLPLVKYKLEEFKKRRASKIARDSHCAILDHILKRDSLKYDDDSE